MPYYNYTLFQDPQIQYPIYDLNLPFIDYVSQCKTIITNRRIDLQNNPLASRIVESNSPFELKPENNKKRYGALLIHGLFDSPFTLKDIGLHLQSEGVLVRSVLLPGHGTTPSGLLNVTYHDWLQAVQYGINSFATEVDQLILVGFSTGADLALHTVLQPTLSNISPPITRLVLVAPAIKISSLYSSLATLSRPFHTISQRLRWLHLANETDYVKYQSVTNNSVYQIFQLSKKIKMLSRKNPITCPMLVIMSEDDKTVSSNACIEYFQQYASPESELIFYTNRKDSFVVDPRFIIRPTQYPHWHIENLSHVATPIAPDNFHYGKQGDYMYASHIDENLQHGGKYWYGSYSKFELALLQLQSRLSSHNKKYLKLTFNPDFEFLTQTISRFL